MLPEGMTGSIWAAGFLSSLSASLSIVLTFLICMNIGIHRKPAIYISGLFGIVPSFWEHAIIGELYSLQMLFILIYVYGFLKNNIFVAISAFWISNLISPLSALAFPLFLLGGINKKNTIKALLVGASSFVLYIIVILITGMDLARLAGEVGVASEGRGIFYRIIVLSIFIILNFHLFLIYFFRGTQKLILERKNLIIALLIGIIPQLLLIFVSSGFFIEHGSFQLLLFWAIAIPVGYSIAATNFKTPYSIISLIVSFILTYFIWTSQHNNTGSALKEAGIWLKENNYEKVSIIGPYDVAINMIEYRDGRNMEYLNNYFFDKPMPTMEDIIMTGKDRLIIAHNKKIPIRKLAADTGIPGLEIKRYEPIRLIDKGVIRKIFENNIVELYDWQK
jgi:hypothetical protein